MKKLYLCLSFLVAATMLLVACGTAATPTAAPVVPTVPPPAPTAVPLGTADNPLVMALAPSANTQTLMAGGDAIAAALSKTTGYTIKTTVPTSYAALIEAMGSGNAQIGWLPPAAFIVAHSKGYADIGMVTLRNGADHYAFEIIANKDAGFTSYYDPTSGANTVGPAQALGQLAGKKPCWTDPLSASGYLVPAGYLASVGVKVQPGAFMQSHPNVVKAVYVSGANGLLCDFGATYVDARSSAVNDFKDVNTVVTVLWVSDARIPNDTVAYATSMPSDMRQKLSDALVQLASTPDGLTLLKNGGYSIGGLKVVDDSFFDDFRAYLKSINFDFNNYK